MKRAPKKIIVVVIEDNPLLREGIASILAKMQDIKVAETFEEGAKALKKIRTAKPTVVLMDIGLKNEDSVSVVKEVKKISPETKVIMMDFLHLETEVIEYIQAGATGFIMKDALVADFEKTIRAVAQGMKVLPPSLTGSLFSQVIDHAVNGAKPAKIIEAVRMTRREREVISLVAEGMTNKEIAQKLNLSTYTIKSHVHNILEKLALYTRVQISNYAHKTVGYMTTTDIASLGEE